MTKLSINRDVLLKALTKIKEVVDSKPILPILSNVQFKLDGNKLDLISSDNETTIIIAIEVGEQSYDPASFLLPFKFLLDTIKLITVDTITIEVKKTSAKIIGFCDEYDINKLQKVDEFPALPTFPDAHTVHINSGFIGTLQDALATTDTKVQGHFTNYVCAHFKRGTVNLVSTTSKSIFKKSFEVEGELEDQLLIRDKIAKALKGFTETQIYWSEHHMAFRSENTTIIAKRPECKYPPYETVLVSFEPNISFKRVEMLSALKKVALAANGDTGATIHLKSSVGMLGFEAFDESTNRRVKAEITSNYSGDADSIVINPDSLITVLEQVDYDDMVGAITAHNKPIFLKAEAEASYMGMQMPIAVPEKK